ncbi:biotin transporter BioY [Pseudorhodoferax sp.]|uniref:biotin transporter BioY n=1 Tax=Pseudorhodoferax sp. TaxID=1993553 RepID=UPI002DD68C15|nr:biotin transporter BioY [Pseudorhodoferax sp.]
MNPTSTPALPALSLQGRSATTQTLAVLLGSLVLAASSQISVPMFPVPMTMQTLAVTLIGALYGWRLGVLTVLFWLAQAAFGLPVLASGTGGLHKFVGPTAGYLFAFPLAAALTGWLAERGWNGRHVLRAFASMLAGNVLCLLVGAAWLALMVGAEKAILVGVAPFVLGALLKSVLGAATLKAIELGRR